MPFRLTDTVPIEEPLAELERHLIAAYVAGAGHDLHDLRTRTMMPRDISWRKHRAGPVRN